MSLNIIHSVERSQIYETFYFKICYDFPASVIVQIRSGLIYFDSRILILAQ
jgi:hypothetical protein